MTRFSATITFACILIATLIRIAGATEVTTFVKYISADLVFLDAGSAVGIEKGDTALVVASDQSLLLLEIVFVAENSASAKIIEGKYTPRIGDRIVVTTAETFEEELSSTASVASKPSETDFRSNNLPTEDSNKRLATRIGGSVGIELFYQDDREPADADVTRPALRIKSSIENLFTNYLSLSVNLRARRISRSYAEPAETQTEWNNRIYEIALQYNNPASSLSYQAGRISSNHISGIGRFDGAMMEYQLRDDLRIGLFGGTLPDYSTSEPQTDRTSAGVYSVYEKGSWQGHRLTGTLGLVGRYNTGNIDREFIYEQMRYSWARQITLYQSAEVSVNRDWRADAEGGSLSLNNFLINGSYSPINSITIDIGFDNRRLVHTYETKDTPDSLFDDALRQGLRAGLSIKLTKNLQVWGRAGLRTREGETTDTRTFASGIRQRNIAKTGITGSFQLNTFESRLGTGTQASISASRYFFKIVYLQLEAGQSRYKFDTLPDVIDYRWMNLGASGNITRHFYASTFGEIYRGDAMTTNRFWLEIGYRF